MEPTGNIIHPISSIKASINELKEECEGLELKGIAIEEFNQLKKRLIWALNDVTLLARAPEIAAIEFFKVLTGEIVEEETEWNDDVADLIALAIPPENKRQIGKALSDALTAAMVRIEHQEVKVESDIRKLQKRIMDMRRYDNGE